ncbi:unknown protein (Partial), partial [Seminavis robusta]
VKWELAYLEALEHHPWRIVETPETADFIIIPIPINSISVAGDPKVDMRNALDALYQEELFQKYPEKHVWMTFLEYAFAPRKNVDIMSATSRTDPSKKKQKKKKNKKAAGKEKPDASGIYLSDYQRLENITTALAIDHHAWNHKVPYRVKEEQGWTCQTMQKVSWGEPITRHSWSMSLMGAATELQNSLEPLTVEAFRNKTYHFLYHSRRTPSMCNSTPHRHALLLMDENNNTQTRDAIKQPSSIGFDIEPSEWQRRFVNVQYCPCVRGDTPFTRCVFRSIRAGCVPIVVSDSLEDFAPIYKSVLRQTDYAVVVEEARFLENPAQALHDATQRMTATEELETLIHGMNLVKRMIVPNYPDSLFVEAFAHETVASQQQEYYDYR